MVSSMTKILLLIVSLICLCHFSTAFTLVPGIAVNRNEPIPQRLEIRTFIQNSTRRNIFLIALERMQQMPTDELLSYYRISCIHGTNFAWDNDTGGNYPNGFGYCYHGDRLFLPWHRPYLSLYEKTLLDLATEIVEGFSAGTHKNRHLGVLKTWRMPYWDWAMDASIPSIMSSKTVSVRRMVNGTLKLITIPNPLSSYRLQIPDDPNVAINPPPPYTIQTVRNPIVRNDTYVTRAGRTNRQIVDFTVELKGGVYDALTLATDYNSFSNAADGSFSIEGVHGTVHVIVGGSEGHMSYVTYAGFDPMFYLHHANVDRLFAMWQVLYPDSYISNNKSEFPNENTELHPFRKTNRQYWTPKLCKNITSLGYLYPELVGWDEETVMNAIDDLYNPLFTAKRRKRALSPVTRATVATSPRSVTQPTATIPSTRTTTTTPTTSSATYDEYKALIQISNTAADSSFLAYVYLGQPSSDDSNYISDPNFVGLFGVFAPKSASKSHKKPTSIAVSLTEALYRRIPAAQLRNPKSKVISDYLNANLQLRIGAYKKSKIDFKGFQIDVVTTKMNLPKKKGVRAVRGKPASIYKATKLDVTKKIDFLPISNDASVTDELDSLTDDLADY